MSFRSKRRTARSMSSTEAPTRASLAIPLVPKGSSASRGAARAPRAPARAAAPTGCAWRLRFTAAARAAKSARRARRSPRTAAKTAAVDAARILLAATASSASKANAGARRLRARLGAVRTTNAWRAPRRRPAAQRVRRAARVLPDRPATTARAAAAHRPAMAAAWEAPATPPRPARAAPAEAAAWPATPTAPTDVPRALASAARVPRARPANAALPARACAIRPRARAGAATERPARRVRARPAEWAERLASAAMKR
jgi:hypothetical protein